MQSLTVFSMLFPSMSDNSCSHGKDSEVRIGVHRRVLSLIPLGLGRHQRAQGHKNFRPLHLELSPQLPRCPFLRERRRLSSIDCGGDVLFSVFVLSLSLAQLRSNGLRESPAPC